MEQLQFHYACSVVVRTILRKSDDLCMSKWAQPDNISVGASVRMVSVEGVARDFGCDRDEALKLISLLGVKLVTYPTGPKQYVNLYALESMLFPLGLPEQFAGRGKNQQGAQDIGTLRLHQELAGVMYTAATKLGIRERVKKLAKEMGKLKEPLTPRPKTATIQKNRYEPINKGGRP